MCSSAPTEMTCACSLQRGPLGGQSMTYIWHYMQGRECNMTQLPSLEPRYATLCLQHMWHLRGLHVRHNYQVLLHLAFIIFFLCWTILIIKGGGLHLKYLLLYEGNKPVIAFFWKRCIPPLSFSTLQMGRKSGLSTVLLHLTDGEKECRVSNLTKLLWGWRVLV